MSPEDIFLALHAQLDREHMVHEILQYPHASGLGGLVAVLDQGWQQRRATLVACISGQAQKLIQTLGSAPAEPVLLLVMRRPATPAEAAAIEQERALRREVTPAPTIQ